jgi:hypothetical protein
MSLVVPDEILTATRMTEAEMRQEIAVMLFQREKLTLAQASRFAEMHVSPFNTYLLVATSQCIMGWKILNRTFRTYGRWADCDYCQRHITH